MNGVTSNSLQISVEAPGGLERRMTVRVPSADIEREVDARLVKVGKTARLKGFRPGKVPQKVVRQRFGGQVREEVLSDVIRSSFSRAVAQEKLNPAGGPRIEPLADSSEEHFGYRATFEVYPDITLGPIAALTIETPKVEIEESDVEDMVLKLRQQRADWRAVERKSKAGDRVIVDFTGKIDNEPFEGGQGREVAIIVGSGQVLEDFDKALSGVAAGESKSAKVKFPKDYGHEPLAGKKAVFDISVHRVEEQVLPEMEEAFLEAFGVKEGGVEALRAEVRGNMERELEERLKVQLKRNVLDGLLKVNPVAVPRTLVEQEIANLQAESMRRLGIKDPEQAPPAARLEDTARRRAALSLLVRELIREHKIELDRPRLDARIAQLAAAFEQPEEVAQIYRGSRELMAQVESSVLEEQVVEFLLDHAKTTETPVSFKVFMEA